MNEEDKRNLYDNEVQLLLLEAHKYGLPNDGTAESRFCLWVGNEIFEDREVPNFMVLRARAKELTQMFLAQDRVVADR